MSLINVTSPTAYVPLSNLVTTESSTRLENIARKTGKYFFQAKEGEVDIVISKTQPIIEEVPEQQRGNVMQIPEVQRSGINFNNPVNIALPISPNFYGKLPINGELMLEILFGSYIGSFALLKVNSIPFLNPNDSMFIYSCTYIGVCDQEGVLLETPVSHSVLLGSIWENANDNLSSTIKYFDWVFDFSFPTTPIHRGVYVPLKYFWNSEEEFYLPRSIFMGMDNYYKPGTRIFIDWGWGSNPEVIWVREGRFEFEFVETLGYLPPIDEEGIKCKVIGGEWLGAPATPWDVLLFLLQPQRFLTSTTSAGVLPIAISRELPEPIQPIPTYRLDASWPRDQDGIEVPNVGLHKIYVKGTGLIENASLVPNPTL